MKTIRALLPTMAVLVLFSCGKETTEPTPSPQPSTEVKVTGISLNKTDITLTEGETETLTATVTPNDATNKTVTWGTSNSGIATVQGGKVMAVKEGTATITAKAGDKQATCKVTVNKKVVAVTDVTLNKTDLPLFVGQTETLVATVVPDNATDKTVTWESSAPDVASVENGSVKALKVGSATITVKAQDKSATCAVTVKEGTLNFTLSSTDAAILKAAGGSAKAVVSTSGSWTVTSSESWLTVSPASGSAGDTEVTLTTTKHTGAQNRTAQITIKMDGSSQSFTVTQRVDPFTRTKLSSGKVTNSVKVTYNSGTKLNRIYVMLPRPSSNLYQDITDYEASAGVTEAVCGDGINNYIWKNFESGSIPASGSILISESFNETVYHVTTDFGKINDIPDYDPNTEECKNYLGKEANGLIDPTHSKIVSTANTLWDEANGNLIEYAHKCNDWTYANMKYGKMNTGLHAIAELMKDMTGDCGNYASVFISLLRAKNIPARHVVMVYGKADEYHVRAEFYVPGYGWIPSDPNWGYDYFGVFTGEYVVVSRGINNIVRGYDGSDMRLDLFQAYALWHWYTGNSPSYTHSCLGLQ